MKILTSIILIISFNVNAQQEPQFSMFWQNYSLFNPANSGLDYEHYANITYRNNWVKLENSPKVMSALYETKIDKFNSGIGVGFLRDRIGLQVSNRYYINYNYQISFNKSKLSLGLGTAYDIMQFNTDWLPPSGLGGTLDPNLPVGLKQGKLNLNFGAVYKLKRLKIGISLTQANQALYEKLSFKKAKHFFLLAQYRIQVVDKFEIIPTFYLKSDFIAGVWDLNMRFIYDKKYWIGFFYRQYKTIGFQAGFTIFNNFNLAYNYDLVSSPFAQYYGATHEFSLGVKLK